MVDGFKGLVRTALSTILKNENDGECQQNVYVVGMEYNAIIRVDISSWRYNYTSDAIIGKVKNVYYTTFCKSIVDHSTVRLDTLIYVILQQAWGGIDKSDAYINKLKRIWELLENESPLSVQRRVTPLLNVRHDAYMRLNKF